MKPEDSSRKFAESLIGTRSGRLLVTDVSHYTLDKHGHKKWYVLCDCDCGTKDKPILAYNIRSNASKSCGCSRRTENYYIKRKPRLNKGFSKTRIYQIYHGMLKRCYNKNNKSYNFYGGRGVCVCDEWLGENGFMAFYEWSKSNGYKEELTIDRIDVNGDYSPSNCRWSTWKEQANNKRGNKYIEYLGEKHTISEWSDIVCISARIIARRIRDGWCVEEALGFKAHVRSNY